MKKVKHLLVFCFYVICEICRIHGRDKSCSRTICGRLCSPPPLFLTRIASLTFPWSYNDTLGRSFLSWFSALMNAYNIFNFP